MIRILNIISGRQSGWRASLTRGALSCLTPIYRAVIAWRNFRFDRADPAALSGRVKRASLPVVSIGNLTTGGTGKTPHVIALAQQLRQAQVRVAIVSRGYGSAPGAGRNDEALEMEHRLPDVPHLQDPDRYRMAEIAADELESELVLLDDGFQHRQLFRNLDIVLIDATNPFGYQRLLPRGLLREPVGSLRRADWVIVSRSDLVPATELQQTLSVITLHVPESRVLQTRMQVTEAIPFSGQAVSVAQIQKIPTFSFCGIGNPRNFATTLERNGVQLVGTAEFPDHHAYTREDLAHIGSQALAVNARQILCTHKDLVKIGLNQINHIPLLAIVIDVDWTTDNRELMAELIGNLSEDRRYDPAEDCES